VARIAIITSLSLGDDVTRIWCYGTPVRFHGDDGDSPRRTKIGSDDVQVREAIRFSEFMTSLDLRTKKPAREVSIHVDLVAWVVRALPCHVGESICFLLWKVGPTVPWVQHLSIALVIVLHLFI